MRTLVFTGKPPRRSRAASPSRSVPYPDVEKHQGCDTRVSQLRNRPFCMGGSEKCDPSAGSNDAKPQQNRATAGQFSAPGSGGRSTPARPPPIDGLVENQGIQPRQDKHYHLYAKSLVLETAR